MRPLFHGTSSYFVRALLLGEGAPIKNRNVFRLAEDLYDLMIEISGTFNRCAELYSQSGNAGTVAPLALMNIHEKRQSSLIAYGDFYVSIFSNIAASYAANSLFGSELLRFIDETISALRAREGAKVSVILARYPDAMALFSEAHQPVVLELHDIPLANMFSENGDAATEEEMDDYEKWSVMGARVPGSFRVSGDIASNVRAIYRVRISEDAPPPGYISDNYVHLEPVNLHDLIGSNFAGSSGLICPLKNSPP